MVASLQYGARCPCGYCHISDVESHKQEDHMESYFLSETVKYLWLLFDLAVGPDNLVEKGPYKYIFSTEGHLLPATPEISLLQEHCSYFGAFCKRNGVKHRYISNISDDFLKNGDTRSQSSWDLTNVPFEPTSRRSVSMPGVIKKFGISYLAEEDSSHDKPKKQQDQSNVVQTRSLVLVSNTDVSSSSNVLEDENTIQRSDREGTEPVLVSDTDVSSNSDVEDLNGIRKPVQEDTELETHQNS